MRAGRAGALSRAKIKSLPELLKIVAFLRYHGKKIVFTNGCFDILHYGHVRYLEDAKKCGDVLIAAINSDSSIKLIKGKNRPIVGQHDRAGVIAGLQCVDFVILFSEKTPLQLIKKIKPDVLVKGSDWAAKDIVGSDVVVAHGGCVKTIPLVKGRSTTNLIKKIEKIFRSKEYLSHHRCQQ